MATTTYVWSGARNRLLSHYLYASMGGTGRTPGHEHFRMLPPVDGSWTYAWGASRRLHSDPVSLRGRLGARALRPLTWGRSAVTHLLLPQAIQVPHSISPGNEPDKPLTGNGIVEVSCLHDLNHEATAVRSLRQLEDHGWSPLQCFGM